MTRELAELFTAKEKDAGKPDEFIFTDRFGRKIKSFSGSFDAAVKDLGLNDGVKDRRHKVVPHTLRHTFASWLAMADVSLQTIMVMMGHGRIEQTQRYAHLAPDKQRQAVALLDAMLAVPESSAIGEIATQDIHHRDVQQPQKSDSAA